MTSNAALGLKRSPSAELWHGAQRERALIALFDLGRQKSFTLRAARLYSFGVFAGYGIAIALSHAADRRAAMQGLIEAALISLSWVVGALAALGAAQILAQGTERDALGALAVQRGFSRAALGRARTLSAALRIARLVALPALLLVALAVARGSTPIWALVVAPGVIVYASALGLGLALLAHFSAELSPRHPRAMLIALVLGPLLISQAYPEVPNVPRLYSGLLAQLLDLGARLA